MKRITTLCVIMALVVCSCGTSVQSQQSPQQKDEQVESVLETNISSTDGESIEDIDSSDNVAETSDDICLLDYENTNDYGDYLRFYFYLKGGDKSRHLIVNMTFGEDNDREQTEYLMYNMTNVIISKSTKKTDLETVIMCGDVASENMPYATVYVEEDGWNMAMSRNSDGSQIYFERPDWYVKYANIARDDFFEDRAFAERAEWFVTESYAQFDKIR